MEKIQPKLTMTSKIVWLLVAILGAVSFGILAISRGEHVNAVWLVLAAICVYSIAIASIVYLLPIKSLNSMPDV